LKENDIFGHITILQLNSISLIRFIEYKYNYIFKTVYSTANGVGFGKIFVTGSINGGKLMWEMEEESSG